MYLYKVYQNIFNFFLLRNDKLNYLTMNSILSKTTKLILAEEEHNTLHAKHLGIHLVQ